MSIAARCLVRAAVRSRIGSSVSVISGRRNMRQRRCILRKDMRSRGTGSRHDAERADQGVCEDADSEEAAQEHRQEYTASEADATAQCLDLCRNLVVTHAHTRIIEDGTDEAVAVEDEVRVTWQGAVVHGGSNG